MMKLSIEIKTKSYQRLREELGIPEDEIWVQDLEHGLEITVEPQRIIRTADWESIVSLTFTVISGMPALAAGAKWLYEKIKKSQVADDIEVVRCETVPFTEATLLELLQEVRESNQMHMINASASSSPTIPEQIQQLVVLHQTGALTDEEFTSKKAELLARM
jgi:hypothetical protein